MKIEFDFICDLNIFLVTVVKHAVSGENICNSPDFAECFRHFPKFLTHNTYAEHHILVFSIGTGFEMLLNN